MNRLHAFRLFLAAAALTTCAACAAAQDGSIRAGAAMARAHCASCHAVGRRGTSPNPRAPAFRDLAGRYPLESLEEALAEGIAVGHHDMPEFTFDPDDIAALIAYMRSVSARR